MAPNEDFLIEIEPSQVIILPPPSNDIVISGTYDSTNAPDTHVGFVVRHLMVSNFHLQAHGLQGIHQLRPYAGSLIK